MDDAPEYNVKIGKHDGRWKLEFKHPSGLGVATLDVSDTPEAETTVADLAEDFAYLVLEATEAFIDAAKQGKLLAEEPV